MIDWQIPCKTARDIQGRSIGLGAEIAFSRHRKGICFSTPPPLATPSFPSVKTRILILKINRVIVLMGISTTLIAPVYHWKMHELVLSARSHQQVAD
jgi:hypothetical protein